MSGRKVLAGLAALLLAGGAAAHGIVLEVAEGDGPLITGSVRYTDESPSARTLSSWP